MILSHMMNKNIITLTNEIDEVYIYTLPTFSCVAIGPHCARCGELCGQID